jgi:hypothetical protein
MEDAEYKVFIIGAFLLLTAIGLVVAVWMIGIVMDPRIFTWQVLPLIICIFLGWIGWEFLIASIKW